MNESALNGRVMNRRDDGGILIETSKAAAC
jgi:hypothetical protein